MLNMKPLPPLRFVPWAREMVWGKRRLHDQLGRTLPNDNTFGESWELSDHPSLESKVQDGPWGHEFVGKSLRNLMHECPEAIVGEAKTKIYWNKATSLGHGERFPLLVKWLDASDWLSVQVHPDTLTVQTLFPGEGSKTEAWLILEADPNSRVWAGLKPGVGEKELRNAIASGTSADCLHSFTPKPGQFLFLPAGTVHAVGGGVLMAEIQQTSDATFRLFDWNRVDGQGKSRKLHIEESIASIHWDKGPQEPLSIPGFGYGEDKIDLELVNCPFFRLSYRRDIQPFNLVGNGLANVVMVVGGSGEANYLGRKEVIKLGDTLLMPASCKNLEIVPKERLELWIGVAY